MQGTLSSYNYYQISSTNLSEYRMIVNIKYKHVGRNCKMCFLETSSTIRVSESVIRRENEKRDTRISRKARIRGPTLLQGEGAETESKPALSYFQP
jgi:hypothetical protein